MPASRPAGGVQGEPEVPAQDGRLVVQASADEVTSCGGHEKGGLLADGSTAQLTGRTDARFVILRVPQSVNPNRAAMPDHLLSLIPDRDAVDLVMQMMAIPGKSSREQQISDFIVARLREAGVPDSAITFDTAHKRSPLGGEVGNLIVKLPGTTRGPRRLLMGHTDTVPLCVGCQPVREGDVIASRDPATA